MHPTIDLVAADMAVQVTIEGIECPQPREIPGSARVAAYEPPELRDLLTDLPQLVGLVEAKHGGDRHRIGAGVCPDATSQQCPCIPLEIAFICLP